MLIFYLVFIKTNKLITEFRVHSKHALTNLKNRYTAVLKKCHLINTFGSLALVGFLCLSANTAQAADGAKGPDLEVSNQTFTFDSTSNNFEQALSKGEDATGSDRGGDGGSATANNNTTNTSGTVTETVYGGIAWSIGGESEIGAGGNGGTATASNNTVHVNGTVEESVYGGYAYSGGGISLSGTGGNGGIATANYNTVHVNGTVESNVYGGSNDSLGGGSNIGTPGNGGNATANYNTVNVYGTVERNVYGGNALSLGTTRDTATASYNTVHLNNATIGTAGVPSLIIGGVASGDASSRAENNTVILSNNLTYNGDNLFIAGGSSDNLSIFVTPNLFNGNTIIFNNYKGSAINYVGNFEKYVFVLPASGHESTKIDNINLTNNGTTGVDEKFASVTEISTLGTNYAIGNTYTLITTTNAIAPLANNGQNVTGYAGTFLTNTWHLTQDANNIFASLKSRELTPEGTSKAQHLVSTYGETVASMLTTSNDALLIGIESARDNVQLASGNAGLSAGSHMKQNVFMPFASVYGGYSSVGDDNNIDINSLSFVGGIGYTSYFSSSELLLAAFFETGHGGYNSYDNNIHSQGDANYYGGGLYARFDMYTVSGNAYIEASAKVGSMHYDYYSDDIKNALGVATSYDVDSLYYGAHAGLGYVWNISDALALDMSAKYFYAHQEGYDEVIGGNNFDVDALDSHRVKAGARLTYTMPTSYNFTFAPYMGLYYEHEFNDDVNATVDNFAVPSDNDSNGSTGILELGVKLASTMGLSANIGVEASLGARESVMGKLEFKYVF